MRKSATRHHRSRGSIKVSTAIGLIVVALAIGAGVGFWYSGRSGVGPAPSEAINIQPPGATVNRGSPSQQEVVVNITPEAADRMGLKFAIAEQTSATATIRVPGNVEANGYLEVPVLPVTGGIVTAIDVELGDSVRRGDRMAQVFSQELADAQSNLIEMNVQGEVERKRLERIRELVRIGAASEEELETIEGEHQLHMTHIDQARQKLLLLGLTPPEIDRVMDGNQVNSDVLVPAPIDGIVIDRDVNLGQVVANGQELFTVVDLGTVWIEGNLLEDDFALVREGSRAEITTVSYPGRVYRGPVEYIDPRVDPQTRSAKVRVAVDNSDRALRLGMYADMQFSRETQTNVVVIPREAIQTVGSETVVFVPREEGRFEQRAVQLGDFTNAGVVVREGLAVGERVVTEGSFLMRAEALRQFPQ